MIRIIKDEVLNHRFRNNGFLKLRIFDDSVISKLAEVYEKYRTEHEKVAGTNPFHATQDSQNPQMAMDVDRDIKGILAPEVEKHFQNYKFLIGAFLVKEPGEKSVHHLHQDWNFTDESKFFSFNIWVPLVPTNRQNGCLRFLPGSHKIVPTIRPNYEFPFAFKEVEPMIEDFLEDVPTALAECILLDHSVLHSSLPNLSGNPRVVAILTVVPKEAEIVHYFCENGHTLEKYKIEVEDIYYMRRGSRPEKGILLVKTEFNFPVVSKEVFTKWLIDRESKVKIVCNSFQDDYLRQNGFCLLQLFSNDEIEDLNRLYIEVFSTKDISGLYANHNRGAVEQSIRISEEIRKITATALANKLVGYEFYIGHFVIKAPETVNEFSLHQDWNIVEETKEKSFQIWIPLSAVDRVNGGLFVLPGSHRFYKNYRSGSYGIPLVPAADELKKHIMELTVPCGSAVMFQNNLFHGSFPNLSQEYRVSILINIVQKGVNTYFFHKNESKQVTELYPMTSNVLLSNLHILEKGIIPETMIKEKEVPLSGTDNVRINANELVQKLNSSLYSRELVSYNIINDQSIRQKINQDGYCVLPFLSSELVNALRKFFQESIVHSTATGRYTSLENDSVKERLDVFNKVSKTIQPHLDRIFCNYKTPILQFFVKMHESSGEIDYHTDTTLLLNQKIEPNYAIWIPLEDVNEHNGTLIVVPGSHKWYEGVVASNWPLFPYLDKIKRKAITLKIDSGNIVIFDTRVVHSSSFNNSKSDRICIAGRIVHQISQLYSFSKKDDAGTKISVFAEDDDFYYQENKKYFGAGSFNGRYVGDISELPLSEKCIQELDAKTDN